MINNETINDLIDCDPREIGPIQVCAHLQEALREARAVLAGFADCPTKTRAATLCADADRLLDKWRGDDHR